MRRLREMSQSQRTRLTLLVAAVVLVGSLVPDPSAASSAVSLSPVGVSTLSQAFSLTFEFGADKVVHALSYAVIAGLFITAWERRPRLTSVVAVVVLVTLFGAGVEVAQAFVPGRTTSAGDLVANALGATLGVVVVGVVDRVESARAA